MDVNDVLNHVEKKASEAGKNKFHSTDKKDNSSFKNVMGSISSNWKEDNKSKVEILEKQVITLKNKNKSLDSELVSSNSKINNLKKEITELKTNITNLKSANKKLENKIDKYKINNTANTDFSKKRLDSIIKNMSILNTPALNLLHFLRKDNSPISNNDFKVISIGTKGEVDLRMDTTSFKLAREVLKSTFALEEKLVDNPTGKGRGVLAFKWDEEKFQNWLLDKQLVK